MAANRASALLLTALFLFAAADPAAHGLGLTVGGQLCCTSAGNCPGQPVSGGLVSLNCTILGVSATVGQAITNANGNFNITIPGLAGLLSQLIPCNVYVQLPLQGVLCPVLNSTAGLLTSALRTVGVVSTAAFGTLEQAVATGFVNVGV